MAAPQPLNLQPREAIEYLTAKGMHVGFDWRETEAIMHAKSFTVAKAMEVEILSDIRDAVVRAISQGKSFQSFRKELEPLLVRKGWWGRREMLDPLTGKMREVQLGSVRRLEIIYDTNLRSAYAWGEWQAIQRTKEFFPFLRYSAVQDSRTRPQHMAWHNIVLPVDHPWWRTHFPPNGWRCRCEVVQMTERDLENSDLKITTNPPTAARMWTNRRTGATSPVPIGIDPGFAHNVGTVAGGQLADVVQNATVPAMYHGTPEHGARMWREVMDRSLTRDAWGERFRDWVRSKPGRAGVANEFVVGALPEKHLASIGALLGADWKSDEMSAAVVLTRRRLDHIRKESKTARGAAVGEEDILRMPEILLAPKAVILDHATDGGRKSVLYVFDPADEGSRAGKIVVRVDQRGKVPGADGRQKVRANWIVSAGRTEIYNLKGRGLELIAGSLED